MATIEYLNKRLEGKLKEIEKLGKKIERMNKAKATNWEVNPYCYNERDLKWAERDLTAAKEAKADLEKKLGQAIEKSQSRNIKAILDFLDTWREKVTDYYVSSFDKYLIAKAAYHEEDHAYTEWYNSESWKISKEERQKKVDEHRKASRDFAERWSFMFPYIKRELNKEAYRYEEVLDLEKLAKELKAEADAKYDDIIERTNEITGKITDASALSVGAKGELNGFIIGERGTAKVETIGAGGHNIQCYHFRTLIHKIA